MRKVGNRIVTADPNLAVFPVRVLIARRALVRGLVPDLLAEKAHV